MTTFYPVTEWMLAALVILPFLFGLLVGIKWTMKRVMIRVLKVVSDEKLNEIMEDTNEEL